MQLDAGLGGLGIQGNAVGGLGVQGTTVGVSNMPPSARKSASTPLPPAPPEATSKAPRIVYLCASPIALSDGVAAPALDLQAEFERVAEVPSLTLHLPLPAQLHTIVYSGGQVSIVRGGAGVCIWDRAGVDRPVGYRLLRAALLRARYEHQHR